MKLKDKRFYSTVCEFLTIHLPKRRCLSENTIKSYKTAINLFIDYLTEEKGVKIHKLSFAHLNSDNISAFLDWLQSNRGISASSRNQRLMALRSFAKFAASQDAEYLSLQAELASVPMQKSPGKTVEFLSEDALKCLLEQPNRNTKIGMRDCFFMSLMYDTAARVGEMLSLRLNSFVLNQGAPFVRLSGKGDKVRTVPIMDKTVAMFKQYCSMFHSENPRPDDYLFFTTLHGVRHQMSVDAVASFLKKYGKQAKEKCLSIPDNLHPHQLRHTRAIHLYRGGVPLTLVDEYLGHVQVTTAQVYAYADTEMKRAAIRKIDGMADDCDQDAIWENDKEMIKRLYGLA